MMKKLFSKKTAVKKEVKEEKNASTETVTDVLPANAFAKALEQHQIGNLAQADALYRQILAQNPHHADALHFLGVLAYQVRQYQPAVELINKAICITPSSSMYSNLGLALQALSRFEEAADSYQKAIILEPQHSEAYYNLGNVWQELGNTEQAISCYHKALALQPDYAGATLNLGMLLLSLGQLAEGWKHYEIRYHPVIRQETLLDLPAFSFQQWHGEPIQGKSLLIFPEQGFGDEIQFCRYVSLLKKQGAKFITLMCRTPLKSLFETLADVDQVIETDNIATVQSHDYWTFTMSIPRYCQIALENIPAPIPYLYAKPERVREFALQLSPIKAFKIGICWQGNPQHKNHLNRSMAIELFTPLFNLPDVKFFTLQPDTKEEFSQVAGLSGFDIGREIDKNTFEDAAALIENLDLIISCDTSIAHLAGALGKPVWLLLPFKADWRWLREREDSPWYPTMHIFRQAQRGNWQAVFARLKNRLQKVISGELSLS